MRYDTARARYEAQLAVAHRALFRAQEAADEMNDSGAALDLDGILGEISRLADDSLRTVMRKRREQPTLPGV